MRGYNSNSVEVAWQELDFKEGLATGTYITPARTGPSFTQKTQANGKLIRSFTADRSGILTVLVNQASDLHQQLLAKFEEDRVSQNVVGPMVIKEVSSGRQTTFKNAYIQTIPDEPFGMEDSDLSWVFGFESVEYTTPLSNANIVGS